MRPAWPPGSPNWSFFVGGGLPSVHCNTPVRIAGELAAMPRLDLLGLVWGVELKGSGFAGGPRLQCEIPSRKVIPRGY